MSEYRQEAGEVAREARWTFFRFLPMGIIVVLVLFALGFGLNSIGLLGGTVVKRKVFENSFQYSEARKGEIAVFTAQQVEIEGQLSNPGLDAGTRANLEAQAASLRVQLSAARSKQ